MGEAPAPLALKPAVQLEEEVVVAEAPVFPDPPADRFAGLVEDLAAGAAKPGVTGRTEAPRRLFEPIEGAEQRIGGKLRALLQGRGERFRPVAPEPPGRREERFGVGEPRLDLVEVVAGARRPVLPAIQPASGQHLLAKRLPVLRPSGPHLPEEAAPRRLLRLDGNVERRPPVDAEVRLRPPLPDPVGKLAGPEPSLLRVGREGPRGGIHAPPPEVARRARDELVVVPAHLELEGKAAVEGQVREHPLAEPVDREDVRPIDVLEGRIEPPRRRLRIEAFLLLPGREQLRGLGAFVRRPGRERSPGGSEDAPDPIAELGARGPGERHHEDLVEPPPLLHDEPGDDAGERPGLARAGARFDEGHAAAPARNGRRGDTAGGGARPAHPAAPASGARRSAASASNPSVTGSRSS